MADRSRGWLRSATASNSGSVAGASVGIAMGGTAEAPSVMDAAAGGVLPAVSGAGGSAAAMGSPATFHAKPAARSTEKNLLWIRNIFSAARQRSVGRRTWIDSRWWTSGVQLFLIGKCHLIGSIFPHALADLSDNLSAGSGGRLNAGEFKRPRPNS
jgi:hypothetical protein